MLLLWYLWLLLLTFDEIAQLRCCGILYFGCGLVLLLLLEIVLLLLRRDNLLGCSNFCE